MAIRVFWRRWVPVLVIVLALWVAFTGYIWWAMNQPPEKFGRVMAGLPTPAYFVLPFETMWTHARAGRLHLGDAAPDFTLTMQDKSGTVELAQVTAKQPVVLVFGSYT